MSLSAKDLNAAIEHQMQSFLGKVTVITQAQSYPLSGMVANQLGKGAMVLVGEAGHIVPPIGAQGFNLGIRDIEVAVELLCEHEPSNWHLVGEAYHKRRLADVNMRSASVDLLNRSLLSDFLPSQIARSLGLFTLGTIGPLRRMMMREGVVAGGELAHLRDKIASGFRSG